MAVIQFPGHLWARCTNKHCHGCHLCHGGLNVCQTCGGLEGAMTTNCPGHRLSGEILDMIYAGHVDYQRGSWQLTSSPHSPAHYRS